METKFITLADYKAWDQYVLKHVDGGIYLAIAWKESVEKGYGHQTFYLATYINKTVVGGLPLIFVKPPLGKGTVVSLPFCDYGGLLADSKEIAGALLGRAVALARELGANLEIRTTVPCPVLDEKSHFVQITDKCRMVLALPASADLLLKSFKSKLRSQVNKAVKNGLICKLGQIELLPDFFEVFSRNMRDLGSPVHSESWLRRIVTAYDEKAKICVVYKESIPVAGGIILGNTDTVTIPWASSLREYNRFSPNMLLYWTLLEYAADHNFKIFDFGRSTPGEGTYAFKKQWGAVPVPLSWYRLTRNPCTRKNSSAGRPFRSMFEGVWKHFPLAIANFVGPCLRKYIPK